MSHWMDLVGPETPTGAFLPWKLVEPRVGISRTTAWRLQKTGDFPKPYVISRGRVGYRESEVEAWKASRAHRGEAREARLATARRLAMRPPGDDTVPSSPPPLPAEATPDPDFALTSPEAGAPRQRGDAPAPRLRSKPRSRDQMTFDF